MALDKLFDIAMCPRIPPNVQINAIKLYLQEENLTHIPEDTLTGAQKIFDALK